MTSATRNTGRKASNAEIDRAIDVVARTMTEGSTTGADFRRRVLAGIESGRGPRTTWRTAFVLSPVAAAAVILIAVFVSRGYRTQVRLSPDATVSVRLKPDTTSPGVPRKPDTTGTDVGLKQDTTGTDVRLKLDATGPDIRLKPDTAASVRLKPDTTGLPIDADTIEALVAPSLDLAPLAIDALAPDPIQLERLDTTSPITIAPITVAPIDVTDVQRR